MKKFDYIIGNPAYQDDTLGDNKGFAPPIYHHFLDQAGSIAHKTLLIHPARFLFNAGSTPKAWNKKKLADKHFKVEWYEPEAVKIFPNADIKGGIAVTYHDDEQSFDPIGHFVPYAQLRSILEKIKATNESSFATLIVAPEVYKFTEAMHSDHPNIAKLLSKGH